MGQPRDARDQRMLNETTTGFQGPVERPQDIQNILQHIGPVQILGDRCVVLVHQHHDPLAGAPGCGTNQVPQHPVGGSRGIQCKVQGLSCRLHCEAQLAAQRVGCMYAAQAQVQA